MIYEAYVKESKIIDKTDEEKSLDLVKSLIKTKYELDSACKNFEFAEGELVDYYSYQIKANQAKINYLLKRQFKSSFFCLLAHHAGHLLHELAALVKLL